MIRVTRTDLAARIDHTLLRPEATETDVARLCVEAISLGVAAVCVSPPMVRAAVRTIGGAPLPVACVVGFPSGAHLTSVKASEALAAVADGAIEIDMVADLGAAAAGQWDRVASDVASVRAAVPRPLLLKVILESGLWSAADLTLACQAAKSAGADFVKTSTGFHLVGGATVDAVTVMAAAVGPDIGVKASGGISSAAQAVGLLAAGATRLGMSRTGAVLAELDS